MRLLSLALLAGWSAHSAVGCAKSNEGGAASGSEDPRDRALGAFALEAGRTMVAAARQQPHDTRWDGFNPARDLRATSAAEAVTLGALGPQADLVAVYFELEGLASGPAGTTRLRTGVIAYPDGRVRWTGVRVSPDTYTQPNDPSALGASAPALLGGFNRTVEALRGACVLPVVSPPDVAIFPPEGQRDLLRDTENLPAACMQVRSIAAAWQPHFDDITAIVRNPAGQFARVRSSFELANGRIFLNPARVRGL